MTRNELYVSDSQLRLTCVATFRQNKWFMTKVWPVCIWLKEMSGFGFPTAQTSISDSFLMRFSDDEWSPTEQNHGYR